MILESDLVQEEEGHYVLAGPVFSAADSRNVAGFPDSPPGSFDRGEKVAQLGATLGREFLYEFSRLSPLLMSRRSSSA